MRPRMIQSARLRSAVVFAAIATIGVSAAPRSEQAPPGGQAPTTVGMIKKGKAPVSNDVLKVKLPRPQEAHHPSGLHIMVLEDHRLPRITAQILIPGAGGYYDPAEKIGLAQYTAQMMREGTKSLTSQQMAQELESMAASVNVGAGIASPNASVRKSVV